MPSWINEKLRIHKVIKKRIGYKGNIMFIPHHLSHAASAFLVSPFNKAAIITIDGVGEWTTASYGIGDENKIKIMKEIQFPHSLGLLYSTVTAFLGFKVNNDEYKIMGLSAYGKPKYIDAFKKIIEIKNDGSFKLNMEYFAYHYKKRMYSNKFVKILGKPRVKEPINERHKDIAASLQKITEEIIIRMANHVHKTTRMTNLCMAGGVALNSVANGLLYEKTKFKNIFIQPAASDAGGAIGVGFYINSILNKKRDFVMNHAFFGPGFSDSEIKESLRRSNISFKEYRRNELLKTVAKLIWNNKIIGWFQGRMEIGPRALGNRSILANPCNPKMKDIVNKKVKHREEFRPFAPAVCYDKAKEFFDINEERPFMLKVCNVKKEKRRLVPAITHIDGSARIQTVRKEQNPLFYNLIDEFGKLSKVPVLLNTSFNVKGEPIVCSLDDAYKCFKGTEIDYLVMGNFMISKENI